MLWTDINEWDSKASEGHRKEPFKSELHVSGFIFYFIVFLPMQKAGTGS